MQNHSLSKAISFYAEEEARYFADVDAAHHSFFSELRGDLSPEEEEGAYALFWEWLLFDHRFADGKTFLERYREDNTDTMNEAEARECRDLSENECGMFLVKGVVPGKEISVQSLSSGNLYTVCEHSGSKSVSVDDLICARIARLEDHWEIVSGKVIGFGEFHIGSEIQKQMKESKERMTSKDFARMLYGKNKKSKKDKRVQMSVEEAESRLRDAFHRYGIGKKVSVERVKNWIQHSGTKNAVFRDVAEILHALATLGRELKEKEYDAYTDILVPCLEALNNNLPHKRIGGKTPNEARAESFEEPVFRTEMRDDPAVHINVFNQAILAMQQGDPEKMKMFLDRGFTECLENRTVFPDPYRPFGNLSSYYAICGKSECAKRAAQWALDLNPKYAFGKRMLDEAESMDFGDVLRGTEMRERFEELERMKKLGEKVSKMKTVDEVIAELKIFGVTLDQNVWIADVRKKRSTVSAKEKYMDDPYLAQCKKKGEEPRSFYDGFFLDVSDRLWVLMRNDDERVFEDCMHAVHALDDGFDGEGVPNLKIVKAFFAEMNLCLDDRNGDAVIREMRRYEGDWGQLYDILFELYVHAEWREEALRLLERWAVALPKGRMFQSVLVLRLMHEKKPWRDTFDRLVSTDPYEIAFHSDMAYVLRNAETDYVSAREILSEALERVRRCDQEKKYEVNHETLYESYMSVIEELIELNTLLHDRVGIKESERFLREIEERKEELSFSRKKDTFREAVGEVENTLADKELEGTPAKKYYDFLKKTGIVFATETLTQDHVTIRKENGEKVGRNDSCVCGSGKKYKKCCL